MSPPNGRQVRNYDEIREKALSIRLVFSERQIQFQSNSAIGTLLRDAEALAESFRIGPADGSDFQAMLNAAHLDRMADALLLLAGESNCDVYLRKLTSNSLNFLERRHSYAKDFYWEIEMWALLKRNFPAVALVDPPDIILQTPDGPLPIACKKIYSPANVANQLSSAIKQLKPFAGIGIVAINIDDLVPADAILRSRTIPEMSQFIEAANMRFLASCRQPVMKYFESGRLSAIAVCTNLLAEITNDGTRFNNARHMTVWAWPNVATSTTAQLSFFAQTIGAPVEHQW